MSISDETLAAYVAGTLSPRARARVEAALASDPALAERLRRHVIVKDIVQNATSVASQTGRRSGPGPEAERPRQAQIVRLAAVRETRRPPPPEPGRRRAVPWVGMAVCTVLGLLTGILLAPEIDPVLIGRGADGLTARGSLAQALTQAPSRAAPRTGSTISVFSSFRATDGAYCRIFRTFGPRSKDGIACREAGLWLVRAVAPTPGVAGSPSPLVRSAAAEMILGQPLSPSAEERLLASGWR